MAEFSVWWRYPPITFLRIIYLAKTWWGDTHKTHELNICKFVCKGSRAQCFFTLPLRGVLRCKYLFKV
jgi:hypothetical protein